jgi:hypothetical protein
MSHRRWRWTSTELHHLEQLRAEGIEVDFEVLRENKRSPLQISEGPDLGCIVDLGPFATGYAISVHLVSSSRLYLEQCFIASDWHSEIKLEEFEHGRFKFGPVTYRPEDVLNPKFQERAALTRGRVIEGYILAWGQGLIPSDVRNGTYSVQLTIVDTLGGSASQELRIVLERATDCHHRLLKEVVANTVSCPDEAGGL